LPELFQMRICFKRESFLFKYCFNVKTLIHTSIIQEKLKSKGLKVTPQRSGVLEAVYTLRNHPTAEQIIDFVREKNPNVATGTVYKTLDTFVKNGVIRKVRTADEATRYDGILSNHHHLFSTDNDHIEDYENEELDTLLNDFFKKIPLKILR